MLSSGFLQHMYWVSSDSLLVILHRYRLQPDTTSSSSRCHGARGCPAKAPFIVHQLVAAAPTSVMVDKMVWNLGQNQYSSEVCVRQPACFSQEQARTFSLQLLLFQGAVRKSWATAKPPVSSCLLRGHLSMTTEMHGQVWSSRELKGARFSPLALHQPCSAWLFHSWVTWSLCSAQHPSLVTPQACTAPRSISGDSSSKQERREPYSTCLAAPTSIPLWASCTCD